MRLKPRWRTTPVAKAADGSWAARTPAPRPLHAPTFPSKREGRGWIGPGSGEDGGEADDGSCGGRQAHHQPAHRQVPLPPVHPRTGHPTPVYRIRWIGQGLKIYVCGKLGQRLELGVLDQVRGRQGRQGPWQRQRGRRRRRGGRRARPSAPAPGAHPLGWRRGGGGGPAPRPTAPPVPTAGRPLASPRALNTALHSSLFPFRQKRLDEPLW